MHPPRLDTPSRSDGVCPVRSSSRRTAFHRAPASLSLMFRYRTFRPSANLERLPLILSMTGIKAILSFLGKIPITMIVAAGRLRLDGAHNRLKTARDIIRARVSITSGRALPTLFVPASNTTTLGLTASNSPFSRRQRMFCVRSAPHPKSAAFQPKKFCFQLASRSG